MLARMNFVNAPERFVILLYRLCPKWPEDLSHHSKATAEKRRISRAGWLPVVDFQDPPACRAVTL
jgi:hypothetical protein